MPKTKNPWQPSASLSNLQLRANIYAQIREFFASHHILEVTTPCLAQSPVTDPYIASFSTSFHPLGQSDEKKTTYYLQTSPEYAMKRLLASGSGPIYQISRAFRNGETGQRHNPEFTLLEWYQLDFNHHQLMEEVDELIQLILNTPPAKKYTYAQLFHHYLSIDIYQCAIEDLSNIAITNELNLPVINNKDDCLELLFSHFIEPNLNEPTFVYDFPSSQAALSKIQETDPPTAARFELYVQGMELANGFHELTDAEEQHKRFIKNNDIRKELKLPEHAIDALFLEALRNGLPDCAGVALGIDRLVMLAAKAAHIEDVLCFSWERA